MDVFCSLMNSSLSYESQISRNYAISQLCELDLDKIGTEVNPIKSISSTYKGYIDDSFPLIHPNALQLYAYLLMDVLPYYNLDSDKLQSRKRLIPTYIHTAYRLVNIAIAQQTLTTGDILLPVLHSLLMSDSGAFETGSTLHEDAISVVTHNQLLSKNYLIFRFSRELKNRSAPDYASDSTVFSQNLDRYEAIYNCRARNNENCGSYEELFAGYWNFDPGKNEVIITEYPLSMPSPEDLKKRTYHVPKSYYDLLRLRDRIIDYALRNEFEFVFKENIDDPSDSLRVIDNNGNYAYF